MRFENKITKRNAIWFQRNYLTIEKMNGYLELVKDALIEIMKTDKNRLIPWLPTLTDILAEDWCILD